MKHPLVVMAVMALGLAAGTGFAADLCPVEDGEFKGKLTAGAGEYDNAFHPVLNGAKLVDIEAQFTATKDSADWPPVFKIFTESEPDSQDFALRYRVDGQRVSVSVVYFKWMSWKEDYFQITQQPGDLLRSRISWDGKGKVTFTVLSGDKSESKTYRLDELTDIQVLAATADVAVERMVFQKPC